MNTKVKVGIAIAIVTALIALIVLDQSTSPNSAEPSPEPTAQTPPATPQADSAPRELEIPGATTTSRTDSSSQDSEYDLWNAGRRALTELAEPIQEMIPDPTPPEIKGGTELIAPYRDIPPAPPATADEYVIQPGDTYEGIAKKKYGKGSLWNIIAKANPDVKAYALRVGKKILIPAQPTPTAQNVSLTPSAPATLGGGKIHEVQPGDTLSGISKRYFNTVRHQNAIYDANRDTIRSPDALQVGMKLQIPDLAVRTPGRGVVETSTAAPANGSLYTVKEGDKLWTIAKRHRGQRGILDMIKAIVSANPSKLRSDSTPLRVGWKLIIPN